MKSRLAVSLHRAEQAEAAAEIANSISSDARDIERGSTGVRRRTRSPASGLSGSMKSALQLDVLQGEGSKRRV
jgi:hypothetical protein